jgi:hypothetical protein
MRMTRLMVGAGLLLASLAAAPLAQAQSDYGDTSGYAQAPYDQYGGQDQPDSQAPYAQDYGQSQQDYAQRQRQYQDDYSAYQGQRSAYDAQRRAYEQRRAQYERQRADYDAQYGPGAYDRYYRDHPDAYDNQFGPGAYARDFGGGGRTGYAPYRRYDDQN